jgi:hypothetical protein
MSYLYSWKNLMVFFPEAGHERMVIAEPGRVGENFLTLPGLIFS